MERTVKYAPYEILYGFHMYDEKSSKERMKARRYGISEDLEEEIEMLATKELWKELEELEEMLGVAN